MSMIPKRGLVAFLLWTILLVVPLSSAACADPLPDHVAASLDIDRLNRIDSVVSGAIEQGHMPGAVVLIMQHGQIVFRKASGKRR